MKLIKISLSVFNVAAILLVVGCATRPVESMNGIVDAEIPKKWAGEDEHIASDLLWLKALNEPELESVVAKAIEESHLLKSSAARMAQMDANARLAGAVKYPVFSLDFAKGTQENLVSGVGIVRTDINTLNLSSQWQIDLWGRTRDQHASVLAQLESAGFQYEDLVLSVASSVSKLWFSIVEAQRQYELAIETRDSFESQLNTLEDRYAKGLINAFDLRLFRAQTSTNDATVNQRKYELDVLSRQLQTLLSEYPDGDIEVNGSLEKEFNDVPARLSFNVLTRRPDLRASERALASSFATKKSASKNRLPTIQVSGTWGTSSNDIEDLLDGDFLLESIIGGLSAPIFMGGRLAAERDLAEAVYEEQLQIYHSAILEAFREIETASKSEEYLELIVMDLSKVVAEIKKAYDQAWDLYYRGMRDITAVLDAQRTYVNAQSQFLSIQNQRIQNRIDFHVAIGGDFEPLK